ncbi:MAG: serine/threonine protein kinase [Candidatus Sericytochromatia bacterium]|nr:serine/threonine protein kinase [Candidatus Sericytochromatia bacterium]
MTAEVGQILAGRYHIEQALARGMAQTYAATRLSDQRAVIVKGLDFGQINQWKSYELFEREVRTLQNLSHRGIPRFLDSFQDPAQPGWHYLVIERVPGKSLQEWLESGWRPSEEELKNLSLQVLDILDYMHRLAPPVIHRDLKPSNLILDRDNQQLYLIDFGAVQDALRQQSHSTVVGTFGYMAPEQFSGRSAPATDLYGWGATLLHLLSGRSPAELPQQELRIDFRSSVHCSRELADWLDNMLAPAPEHRFGSAREAREALLTPTMLTPLRGHNSVLAEAPQVARPSGSSIQLSRSDRELQIHIPPGQARPATTSMAFFAVFWNCFVAFWTVLAFQGGLLFAAFSIPFWGVGLFLARQAARGLFLRTELSFSSTHYSLTEQLGGARKVHSGRTAEIQAVHFVLHHKMNRRPVFVLEIEGGTQNMRFGLNLSRAEQHWLRSEILSWLLGQRSSAEGQRLLALSQEDSPHAF